MKNIVIYFCSGKISQDNWIVKKFDNLDFEIHCFEDVSYENSKDIDFKGIISEISNDNGRIYIVSDEIKLISCLFEEYSWKYDAFIYDNYIEKGSRNYKFKKTDLCYNYNFYCINKITTNIKINVLNEKINFGITEEKIDNFIISINEFINNNWNNNYDLLEDKAKSLEEMIVLLDDDNKEKVKSYITSNLKEKNSYFNVYMRIRNGL